MAVMKEEDFLKRQPTGTPIALGAWGRRLSRPPPLTGAAYPPPPPAMPPPRNPLPAAAAAAAAAGEWATAAEASGWARTSTAAETQAYAERLAGSDLPHRHRLVLACYGSSEQGRPLTVVTVADPPIASLPEVRSGCGAAGGRVCVHVNANIHAGEVEGKECVLQLLREFAMGARKTLLSFTHYRCCRSAAHHLLAGWQWPTPVPTSSNTRPISSPYTTHRPAHALMRSIEREETSGENREESRRRRKSREERRGSSAWLQVGMPPQAMPLFKRACESWFQECRSCRR